MYVQKHFTLNFIISLIPTFGLFQHPGNIHAAKSLELAFYKI